MSYEYADLDLRPRTEHYCRACGEPVDGEPDMCCMVDRSTADVDVINPGVITVVWSPSEAPAA